MEKVPATSFSEEEAVSNAARTPTNQPRKLLQHLYDNGKGARIYLDEKNDSYVQKNLGNAVSMSQVEVVLRGDRYFDSNGTTYIRTEHPDLVDSMGMINDRRKGKGEETSERPPLENDVRAKFLTIKDLERVMLDNPRTGLYAMSTTEGTLYLSSRRCQP